MKKSIVALIFMFSSGLVHSEVVVDITKIAGKSKAETAAYLGKETSCEKSKYGSKCQYEKGETEIVFINGKADWITIEGIDEVPFTASALQVLGIKGGKPSFKSKFVMRWESIPKIKSISIFKGGKNSDYAYIKVKTK